MKIKQKLIVLSSFVTALSVQGATLVVGGSDTDWIGDMDGLTKVDGAGDIFVNSTQNPGSPTGGIRNLARYADNNGDWWNVVDIGSGQNVLQRGTTQEELDRGVGFLFDSPGFTQATLTLDHNFASVTDDQWDTMTFTVWGFTSETAADNIKGDWSQVEGSAGDLDIVFQQSIDTNVTGTSFTSSTFDTSGYVAIGFGVQSVTLGGNQSPTGAYPYIDNVQIIPEPSAFALLAGVLGLGLVMLRRRR